MTHRRHEDFWGINDLLETDSNPLRGFVPSCESFSVYPILLAQLNRPSVW